VVLELPIHADGSVNARFTEPAAREWKSHSKRLF
jgi:hypothetical protein